MQTRAKEQANMFQVCWTKLFFISFASVVNWLVPVLRTISHGRGSPPLTGQVQGIVIYRTENHSSRLKRIRRRTSERRPLVQEIRRKTQRALFAFWKPKVHSFRSSLLSLDCVVSWAWMPTDHRSTDSTTWVEDLQTTNSLVFANFESATFATIRANLHAGRDVSRLDRELTENTLTTVCWVGWLVGCGLAV